MSDGGFSTVMDAILFLVLMGACALILGPVISGHGIERTSSDRGLREMAADALCSLETEQVDYFEYRILGNVADGMAAAGGINATSDILYKDLTKALLGRGGRHMTAMDIAADVAACQFYVEYGDRKIRANPVTVEYDDAVSDLIDHAVRSSLDSRYRYEFTLRWSPLAGVPLSGEIRAGDSCPARAISSSVKVSMPYTTDISRPLLEQVNQADLKDIGGAIDGYGTNGDRIGLRLSLEKSIGRCLKNSTVLAIGEIWNNTIDSPIACDGSSNPLNVLKRFVDGKVPDTTGMIGLNVSAKDVLSTLADLNCRTAADEFAKEMADDIIDGSLDSAEARRMVLDWLAARYRPSSAIATISVWTGAYAAQ